MMYIFKKKKNVYFFVLKKKRPMDWAVVAVVHWIRHWSTGGIDNILSTQIVIDAITIKDIFNHGCHGCRCRT